MTSKIATLLMILPLQAFATEFEFKLNNDMAELGLSQFQSNLLNGVNVGANLLFNEKNDIVVSGRLLTGSSAQYEKANIQTGIGVKAYGFALDEKNNQFYSIALGARVRLNQLNQTPFSFSAEAYFAPDITTSGLADGVREISVNGDMKISKNAYAFLGLRQLSISQSNAGNYKLDSGLHLGVQLNF
ncbi:MAG: hypothetical protein HON94_08745 [Methylococcales bacterium]|jgi:hypothetical protein|nr:hypothetical protein [Methylococcales bacterium]MBT7409167.1 hypothetical protein [Methylococcales bacterium]